MSLRRTLRFEAICHGGKLMFGRAIPALADLARTVTLDVIAVFMVGRMAEREGFEPDSGVESDQQVGDSEGNPVPTDPRKSP